MSRQYQLPDGSIAKNLRELSELIGVEKVTREDVQEGGQYADLVTIIEEGKTEDTTKGENSENKDGNNGEDSKDDKDPKDDKDNKDTVFTTVKEEVTVSPEEVKEALPEFEDLSELKEWIKDIDTPTLEYIAKGLKLEWTPTYHPNIHRMRIALALQHYFFPELFKPKESSKKKTAKYSDFTLDDLTRLAKELKIDWKPSGNEPIDRMRIITALKKADNLPS